MSEMLHRVALAMRRRKFERNGHERSFDETLPLTENELDDARAAIKALFIPTNDMWTEAMRHMDSYESNGAWWRAMLNSALGRLEATP